MKLEQLISSIELDNIIEIIKGNDLVYCGQAQDFNLFPYKDETVLKIWSIHDLGIAITL